MGADGTAHPLYRTREGEIVTNFATPEQRSAMLAAAIKRYKQLGWKVGIQLETRAELVGNKDRRRYLEVRPDGTLKDQLYEGDTPLAEEPRSSEAPDVLPSAPLEARKERLEEAVADAKRDGWQLGRFLSPTRAEMVTHDRAVSLLLEVDSVGVLHQERQINHIGGARVRDSSRVAEAAATRSNAGRNWAIGCGGVVALVLFLAMIGALPGPGTPNSSNSGSGVAGSSDAGPGTVQNVSSSGSDASSHTGYSWPSVYAGVASATSLPDAAWPLR